mmetsp:Transcript_36206/g.47564  ORF Transcript_36206/g.47564 Transcript_36206/m.47564 type:complete len:81 (-) Transcript_36206:1393-1635(-)
MIALGEFMDDFDLGNELSESLGLPPKDESDETDITSSLGITLILVTAIVLAIALLTLIIIVILRGCVSSPQRQERLKKVR